MFQSKMVLSFRTLMRVTAPLAVVFAPSVSFSLDLDCKVAAKNEEKVSSKVKAACFKTVSSVLEQPVLSVPGIIQGPKTRHKLGPAQDLHCLFLAVSNGGNSRKFRCLVTNENFVPLSKSGTPIEGVKSISVKNDKPVFLDANKKSVVDAEGKTVEGRVLKVKYFLADDRDKEALVEVAATRIFWMLGLAGDINTRVKKVKCKGCAKDPFEQSKATASVEEFSVASVEEKFPGEGIDKTETSWSFDEVLKYSETWTPEQRVEIEALALATQILQITSDNARQNELSCKVGQVDERTGICKAPVLVIQDLGASFGNRALKATMGDPPRGHLPHYKAAKIFKDASRCTLWYAPGKNLANVGEAARRLLAERISKIDDEMIRALFRAADFGKVDSIGKLQGTKGMSEQEAIEAWTLELRKKFDEVTKARCPKA